MTVDRLLTYLHGLGVVLWIDGNKLRYRAPKGVLTPTLHKEMTDNKEEILAILRKKEAFSTLSPLPLQAASRNQKLSLSYAQQGLWLIVQLTKCPPFNQPLAFRIDGPLNVDLLECSLKEIIRRHEILRTQFVIDNREPIQVVMPENTFEIATEDLRNLNPNERESAAEKIAEEEALKPFDLAKGSLLRAKLLHMDNEKYVFILITHTFTADGYSLGILLWEIGQLYEAFKKGKSSPLPEPPIQFADYAIWQRKNLKSGLFDTQLAYWKQQLKGSSSTLAWPVKKRGTNITTFLGKTRHFTLSWELSRSIRDLGRREGVTSFTVLLAAFKTLLYWITGQTDLVVGTVVSHRGNSKLEGLIGYFANNLLLRTQLSGNLTFQELLSQCHEVAANALAHQDLPYESLMEELSNDSEFPSLPYLQVMFVMHDHVLEEDLKLPGIRVKRFPVERGTASLDLYLRMENAGGQILGSLEYSTEIFDTGTIDLICGYFQNLMECIVLNPRQGLESLWFLGKAEREELIRAWGRAFSNNIERIENQNSGISADGQQKTKSIPQTQLERDIASIWKDILKLEDVRIDDNFFELGGRSVHIMQLHSRMQRLLTRDISTLDLFRYPTIREQSRHLGDDQCERPILRSSHNRTDLLKASRERRMRNRAER